MMKPLTLIVTFFMISSAFAQTKPKLSLYYETICPDTRAFILTQLYPVYQSLTATNLDLEFVPYGKATVDNSGPTPVITCQHGEWECYANKIQGCFINEFSAGNVAQQLELVKCMYEKDDWVDTNSTSTQCAQELSLNWAAIKQCTDGTDGLNIVLENGAKTDALVPKVDFIPWIVINGVHTDAMKTDAVTGLLPFLCTNYLNSAGTELSQCRNGAFTNSVTSLTFLISIFIVIVKFQKSLYL